MQNFLVSFRHFMPLLSIVYSKRSNLTIKYNVSNFHQRHNILSTEKDKKKIRKYFRGHIFNSLKTPRWNCYRIRKCQNHIAFWWQIKANTALTFYLLVSLNLPCTELHYSHFLAFQPLKLTVALHLSSLTIHTQ